jgi:hypothetical protein
MSTENPSVREALLADLLSDDTFRPSEPRTVPETGLTATTLEVCRWRLSKSCCGRCEPGR